MKKFPRAPKELFDKFGDFFPYSTVDVIIKENDSFILSKRTIPPYKNFWNLPGSVIFRSEKLQDTAKRVAREELGITIKIENFLGTYENPAKERHDISHCFIASIKNGKIKPDFQSSEVNFFKKIPTKMVPYQKKMILDFHNY